MTTKSQLMTLVRIAEMGIDTPEIEESMLSAVRSLVAVPEPNLVGPPEPEPPKYAMKDMEDQFARVSVDELISFQLYGLQGAIDDYVRRTGAERCYAEGRITATAARLGIRAGYAGAKARETHKNAFKPGMPEYRLEDNKHSVNRNVTPGELYTAGTVGRIPAIKRYRERTGLGLKESKEALDLAMNLLNIADGCTGIVPVEPLPF